MYNGIEKVMSQIPIWFWGPYGFLLLSNSVCIIFVILVARFLLFGRCDTKGFEIVCAIICAVIPFIGPLFFIFYAFTLRFFLNPIPTVFFPHENYPEFMVEKDSRLTRYGEGGVVAQLSNKVIRDHVKLQALIRLNHHTTTAVNQINESMLQNDFDELRLYAYSMLDKQETTWYNKIHSLEEQLKLAGSPHVSHLLCKALSYYYWELIYLNLAQDEIREFSIEKARFYLDKALAIQPEDLGILVLNARLKLLMGEVEVAQRLFSRAHELGAPDGKVIPYLAEIAYQKRDFKSVKDWFRKADSLAYIPKLSDSAQFWRDHEDVS